ncbi:hypothetical protein Fcan01_10060 [Folsomia candida]|uniref:Phosphodiesterase n=1 Tax=Folsomia candida TaxID=158441 RepID=A0A226EF71_FOLCA|nr:hypothetical protein Fcan01_10060 [Folsomia candida]
MGASCVKNEVSEDQVEEFLVANPDFLESYVTRNVDQETLECWLIDRQKVAHSRKSSLSRWKYGSGSDTRKNMLQELAKSLQRNSQEGSVMWELALCISSAVSADSFTLYLCNRNTDELQRYVANNNTNNSNSSSTEKIGVVEPRIYSMSEGLTMASYAGQRRGPIRLSRAEAEARFPEGLGENPESRNALHILCHPIIRADGDLAGVVELHRVNVGTPFYTEDEEVVNSYVIWGGIALHYAELNAVMNKQKKLNDFLLNVVKSIFQDMVSMDTLIKKVMNYAQKLVDADRASLFLLDNKNKELYARLFDMGGGQDLVLNQDANTKEPAKEIRFSIGTGIAGQVAATGQVLNISDAYADERFNRAVDQVTGYHTKSILCMPVFIRATVIGVVQMVNKRSGGFTKEDEEAFQTFAVYCGLALHHAKLYDKIRRSEQKFKVALEVLSYHNTCHDNEFITFKAHGVPSNVLGLDDYYFVSMSVDDNLKVHYTLYMFIDLFGLSRFDSDHLYRFVLTVRKNYRRVPYHNWTHGFAVANSMYCILKKSNAFRPLECLALFVGCLCHDLDHRGRSNKFMLDSSSPLASIYTTSTMEHHHFNQTVTILQQEGHNIFSKLSSEEYKQALGNIKHCILATDLALFFPNKARLFDLVQREAFSWTVPDHRLLIEAIAMTAADLCASTKAWDAQVETVRVIFEEFYEQGDLEKQAGRTPIPMMDRDKKDEQAASQVGFLSGICVPCYSLLEKLVPESEPLLAGVQRNLERWTEIAAEKKALREARELKEAEEQQGAQPVVEAGTKENVKVEEVEEKAEQEIPTVLITNGPSTPDISPNSSRPGSRSSQKARTQSSEENQEGGDDDGGDARNDDYEDNGGGDDDDGDGDGEKSETGSESKKKGMTTPRTSTPVPVNGNSSSEITNGVKS